MSKANRVEASADGLADRALALRWTHALPEAPLLSQLPGHSFAAEQYRTLATQVEQRVEAASDECPVIVTSSADPGSGKTLTSINLALTLARKGQKRVLLVEGDFWKPTFHRYLNRAENAPGVSDILAGETLPKQAVASIWNAGVDVLFAGNCGERRDLIARENLEKLFRRLKKDYDFIIVDSPPVVLSAGRSLAISGDWSLVVVRSRKSVQPAIEEALSILGPDKVLGMVLNDVRLRTLRHSSLGAYSSYSSYGAYAAYSAYAEAESGGSAEVARERTRDLLEKWSAPNRKGVVVAAIGALLIAAMALSFWLGGRLGRQSTPKSQSDLSQSTRASTSETEATSDPKPSASIPSPPMAEDRSPSPELPETRAEGSNGQTAIPERSGETVEDTGDARRAAVSGTRTRVRFNLRSGPGLEHEVLRTLAVGSELEIQEQQADWYRVTTAHETGWLNRLGVVLDQRTEFSAAADPTPAPEDVAAGLQAAEPAERRTLDEGAANADREGTDALPLVAGVDSDAERTVGGISEAPTEKRAEEGANSDSQPPESPLPAQPDIIAQTAAPTATPDPPVQVRIARTPPKLIRIRRLPYPAAAKRLGIEGTVVVSVLVDERGRVTEAQVEQAVRRHALLHKAALAAARNARFKPARLGGAPIESRLTLRFPFLLSADGDSRP